MATPTLDEIFTIIRDSDYKESWSSIDLSIGAPASVSFWEQTYDGHGWEARRHSYLMVHRERVELAIAWGRDLWSYEESKQRSNPEWADDSMVMDKKASPFSVDILWNGHPIYRTAMYVVDGARAYVPDPDMIIKPETQGATIPEVEGWEIDAAHLRLAEILNDFAGHTTKSVSRYCEQFKFRTVGDPLRLPVG